jgi:hypothetical protein
MEVRRHCRKKRPEIGRAGWQNHSENSENFPLEVTKRGRKIRTV